MKLRSLASALTLLGLVACGTTQGEAGKDAAANAETRTTVPTANAASEGATTAAANTDAATAEKLAAEKLAADKAAADKAAAAAAAEAANGQPKSLSVFFGFDRFDIEESYQSVVEMNADYAKKTGAKVQVAGNTDERGSPEYNLALGQKRANAVARALETLGVDKAKIEAVSYGEEKPMAEGADEDAWSVNRRADISYPEKP